MARDATGLRYIEYEIARCERRIQRIKTNPDPSKPRANLLLYELERELRLEQINAVKEGKPLGSVFPALTRPLGMVPWDALQAADRTYGEDARRYFEIVRAEGMPEHACDRCVLLVAMVLEGHFPKPDFLGLVNQDCMPAVLAYDLLAHLLDIPHFAFDRHFLGYSQLSDDVKLKYVADQLGALIEYAEDNVPGCKYDEDRLVEFQYYNREFLRYWQRLYELKKRVPCPLPGREAFREIRMPEMYPNPAKAVEYMRLYVEEVEERAENRLGAIEGEEKLRLLWSVSGPFFADPFTWLEKRGAVVVAAEMAQFNGWFSGRQPIWGDPWKGRKLTPLEEEARQIDTLWGRLGDAWVRTHVNTCRDLKLDGLVYFLQVGCPTTTNLGKVVADTLDTELDIPTLLVEGRMLDESVFDEREFFSKLDEFLAIALERKADRRQPN